MKVAEAYYRGNGSRKMFRGPSDEQYHFKKRSSNVEQRPREIEKIEDALALDDKEDFDVEWTPLGRIAREAEGAATEVDAMLSDLGYRQKQKMAKALGLNAGGSEDDLDERLQPEVERLQKQMEEL